MYHLRSIICLCVLSTGLATVRNAHASFNATITLTITGPAGITDAYYWKCEYMPAPATTGYGTWFRAGTTFDLRTQAPGTVQVFYNVAFNQGTAYQANPAPGSKFRMINTQTGAVSEEHVSGSTSGALLVNRDGSQEFYLCFTFKNTRSYPVRWNVVNNSTRLNPVSGVIPPGWWVNPGFGPMTTKEAKYVYITDSTSSILADWVVGVDDPIWQTSPCGLTGAGSGTSGSGPLAGGTRAGGPVNEGVAEGDKDLGQLPGTGGTVDNPVLPTIKFTDVPNVYALDSTAKTVGDATKGVIIETGQETVAAINANKAEVVAAVDANKAAVVAAIQAQTGANEVASINAVKSSVDSVKSSVDAVKAAIENQDGPTIPDFEATHGGGAPGASAASATLKGKLDGIATTVSGWSVANQVPDVTMSSWEIPAGSMAGGAGTFGMFKLNLNSDGRFYDLAYFCRKGLKWAVTLNFFVACLVIMGRYNMSGAAANQAQSAGTSVAGTNANSALAGLMATAITLALALIPAALLVLWDSGVFGLLADGVWVGPGTISESIALANCMIPLDIITNLSILAVVFHLTIASAHWVATTAVRFLVG